jgi:hypothetical protein
MERYDLTHDNTEIFIDASSPAVVMAVKKSLDNEEEPSDYLEIIARRSKRLGTPVMICVLYQLTLAQ